MSPIKWDPQLVPATRMGMDLLMEKRSYRVVALAARTTILRKPTQLNTFNGYLAKFVGQKKNLSGTVTMEIGAASKQRKRSQERFFACPHHKFAEMNPSAGRSSCAYQGRGFQNMAELIRHLRRTHREKINRCLKCQQFFKQDIQTHVCRRTGMMRGEGQAKLWFSLFTNLFENAKPPQTPFYAEGVEASPSPNAPCPPQNIGATSGLEAENAVDPIHHTSQAGPDVTEISGLENAVLQQIASLQSAVKLQGMQSATARAHHLKQIYRSLISHTNILTSGHQSSESLGGIFGPENSTAAFTTLPPASQNVFFPTGSDVEPYPNLPDEVPFDQQVSYGNGSLTLDWDDNATQLVNWNIEQLSSFPLP